MVSRVLGVALIVSTVTAGTSAHADSGSFGICLPPAAATSVTATVAQVRTLLGQFQVPNIAPLPATIAVPPKAEAVTKTAMSVADTTTTLDALEAQLMSCRAIDKTPEDCSGVVARTAKVILAGRTLSPVTQVTRERDHDVLDLNLAELKGVTVSGYFVASVAAPSASGSSGGLDSGTVLAAADNFLLTRAQDEVTPWLAKTITDRYCKVGVPNAMPNTCETLAGFETATPASWPSKHALQVAMQADLKLLPICGSDGFLVGLKNKLSSSISWAPVASTVAGATHARPEDFDQRDNLLLMASFVDNLAKGVPLVNDLIGLGQSPYVLSKCGMASSAQDAGTIISAREFPTRLPVCKDPYKTMVSLSVVLYYGANVRYNDWSKIVLPQYGGTIEDYEQNITGFDMEDLLLTLTNDSHTLNGYLASGDQSSSVNWESAAGVVGNVVSQFWPSQDPTKIGEVPRDAMVLYTIDMAAKANDYRRVVTIAIAASGCTDAQRDNSICSFVDVAQNIANATNEDELTSAMNDLSDPEGGWRNKMGETGLWSIGAYVGLGIGLEKPESNNIVGSGGLFAPVGVERSFTQENGWCWSDTDCTLMVGIFDFGGLDYFLASQPGGSNYIVNSHPRSALSSVIALSLGYQSRISHSPFAWGLVYEYAPNLRTETFNGGTPKNIFSQRIMFTFSVDIVLHSW